MARIEYNLYRVKMVRPLQGSLFSMQATPEELLILALKERPSAEIRANYIWHVGNITNLSEHSGYFAIGRTTLTTLAKFDEKSGDFLDEPSETSPYTYIVFDSSIGLLAIAKKALLAPTTKGLASVLERLLESTSTVAKNDIDVEVRIIPDPAGFLQQIHGAYTVKKFSATFTGPNPFDADEYFQKPLSVYAKAANAKGGKASVAGEDLNRQVIEDVAKSTAAVGNEASARIQRRRGQRCITINMSGDPVKMVYEEDEHDIAAVAEDMIDEYNRVRR